MIAVEVEANVTGFKAIVLPAVAARSLTSPAAGLLDACVRAGLNILVSGATHSGKTTMLNALAGSIPAHQRIITAEEVFELNLANRDVVALQCRQSSRNDSGCPTCVARLLADRRYCLT